MAVILATWETDQEDCGSRPAWANTLRNSISKITREKWTTGMASAAQCLPSKHETLSSNPSTEKNKRFKCI
jgi:hypothetical protein